MNKDELFRINTKYCEHYFKTVINYAFDQPYKKAWERVEMERIDIGLGERYTTYNSFRQAFHKHTHQNFTQNKKERLKK